MIDEVFEQELAGSHIFKNLKVLSPHYVPDELPHREKEATEVTRIIAPVLRNDKPGNIFIYGKTGTGKTSVVKYVTSRLGDIVSDPNRNKNSVLAPTVYMNCRVYDTKYKVLTRVLEDQSLNRADLDSTPLNDRADGKLAGLPPNELYERLRKVVGSNNLNLIIALDEIDMVNDLDDLVYLLTRINDELESGNTSIIGITNRFSFKEQLDPRSKSTLCEEELLFKAYDANQLKTILMQRITQGFQENTIRESEVSLIAALAAQVNGDARYALRLLQKSGEIAQNRGKPRVEKKDIQDAKSKVEEDLMSELVTTLPEQQQIVLFAIADTISRGGSYKRLADLPDGILFSGEAYDSYERLCKKIQRKPRTIRWFREYLNDLEMLGLVALTISGKGVRGNTTLIRLGNPSEEIKAIIGENLGIK